MDNNLTLPNKIAILGATSQIAKDLIISFSKEKDKQLHLFARRPNEVNKWLTSVELFDRYLVDDFSVFGTQEFDAIINFVGVGNPSQAADMGAAIFDITLQYDEMALNYLRQHPTCRYIFLSSGAAYGSNFDSPVGAESNAEIAINTLQPQDWYGVAKLHAECRHRSLWHFPIVDIRVFNYFSHTQDIEAGFLITDIVRAIRDNTVLQISADYIVRDYIGPADFYRLVKAILSSLATNDVVDCYSKEPLDKPTLLAVMQDIFKLSYEVTSPETSLNSTGRKSHYYSLNRRAAAFGYFPRLTSLEVVLQEMQSLVVAF